VSRNWLSAVWGTRLGFFGLCLTLLPLTATAQSPKPRTESIVAAVHVHTRFSTGTLSLEELALEAERRRLDAVVLSDNLVLRYEYGLFPFRGVIRRRISVPSVLESGVDAYLAEVAAVQARHPRILIVPGVEVAPHYHWSGSLLDGNLTMHDSQKNLLVLGLTRAQDYLALPVAGLPASQHYSMESAMSLSPVLLLVPTFWLWRRGRSEIVTYDGVSHRYRAMALTFGGATLVLLANAWPFAQPDFGLYEQRGDYRPYQRLIDAVGGLGGIAIWSLPEARDFNRHSFGPLGTVTVMTDPYPQALILTTGYTAFGGLYEDTRHAADPAGVWDHALQLYLSGERPVAPFLTGESAYHGPGPDQKELDGVVTVLRVRERTAAALIEAIRAGRLYGVHRYRKEFGLRLDTFQVEVDGGVRTAESGETLDPEGARDLAVRVSVSATDGAAHPVSVSVIRSGMLVTRLTGTTPFTELFADQDVPSGQWHTYRVEVRGDGEVLSNPVFVGPVPAAGES
jgi:hypothetical protein